MSAKSETSERVFTLIFLFNLSNFFNFINYSLTHTYVGLADNIRGASNLMKRFKW